MKKTIEMQPLELEPKAELVNGKHFLKNIERSENSEKCSSFESFQVSENSRIVKSTVH